MKRFWWLLGTLVAFAQLPCGFYEIDGQPGQVNGDLGYRMSVWATNNVAADLDNDGRVSILDFFEPMACVGNLNHGLLGKYYGYEDGTGASLSFPSFPIPFDPAVVRATEGIVELDSTWDGFLDSLFLTNFATQWDGYLFVPETAEYTLHFVGREGVRLFLDNVQVLNYNAWPYDTTYTATMTYGLHPIRIEYYKVERWGTIAFEWSSNGSIISPVGEIVDQRYLYHDTEAIPTWAVTELEFLPIPPSGTRVTSSSLNIDAFVMGPDSDVHLDYMGSEQVLTEGRLQQSFPLVPGLNTFNFTISDGSGRSKIIPYHIYRDAETVSGSGLVANLYSKEFWNGPTPSIDGMSPFARVVVPGTQINLPNDDEYFLGSTWLTDHVIMHVEGMLNITQAGEYTFYSDSGGGLYINGEFVCGISELGARQWDDRGTLYLPVGRHHYRITQSSTWDAPRKEVEWQFEGGSITQIPNSAFQYGPNHFHPIAKRKAPKTGGRVAAEMEAEFLFQSGAFLDDTSGNDRGFWPDPRVVERSPAGATFLIGSGLTAQQGGVHAVQAIKQSQAFSLEADFTWEGAVPTNWTRRYIVSLNGYRGDRLAELSVTNDNLRFRINGDSSNELEINNFLDTYANQRVHVVATYTPSTMSIFVNGSLAASQARSYNIAQWPNGAMITVGSVYRKRDAYVNDDDEQFHGTIHVAAIYSDDLSAGECNTNRTQNLTLSPNPTALPAPTPVVFPPGGTSQAALDEAHHILNRLTFGPNVSSMNTLLGMGVNNWIDWQLNPNAIDDSAMESYLNSGIFIPDHYGGDLVYAAMFRMIQSERQLLEVMTQFWENHFNTQVSKVEELREEWAENKRFRNLALGNFADLLRASAMNTPMTIYLDSIDNIVGAPNENYAREIFELHALGVNNGYAQIDIEEASRAFSGWNVNRDTGEFYFHPGLHDFGAKNLPTLGLVIPAGGGMSDGMDIIDYLVSSANCADFISWKLCQLLVDDNPPADVVAAASAAFQANSGDIEQTLRAILNHARFRTDLSYRGNKTRTPLEFVAAATRAVEAFPQTQTLAQYVYDMGMNLFDYPFPTGFEEAGTFWVNTNSLLERWNFIHMLTSARGSRNTTAVDMMRFLDPYITNTSGAAAANEINDFFIDLTSHGTEAPTVATDYYNFMTNNSPGSFVVDDATLDQGIRHALSLYLRLPELNKQ